MNEQLIIEQQVEICSRFGAPYVCCDFDLKVGVSMNVRSGMMPLNGLRVEPDGKTCGWYIWAGEEWSNEEGFFVPLHVQHLGEWAPIILPYLGLAPGWRFLVTTNYEDVWRDDKLAL